MRSLHLLFLDWHHLNWKPLITIITKIVIGLRHCISNLLWHCHWLSCLQLFQSCFHPLFPTLTSVLLSYALRPSLLLSQVNLRLIKKVTPMTLTTWQFTSWYYVNAQHLSFSTTLHFVAQPLSSFSILGCHHLNEGAINYKRAIVVDCDCFHLLLSYMLSHHPSCPLTLCPSLLRSILLYLAPPHLISYSKQKENTERSPIDFFPVHVFQTAFSLINWGKWLRTSAPGPVPYIPFSFALMSSASRFASCLLPHYAIKSRFCFPLFIFPIPLPPLLFPPLHPPLLPLHAPCPQNREALMIMYFSSQLDHAIILLEQIFSSPHLHLSSQYNMIPLFTFSSLAWHCHSLSLTDYTPPLS